MMGPIYISNQAGGPLAGLASGAADTILEMNPGDTAPTYYPVTGDATCSGGVFTVSKLGGVACSPLATLANGAADKLLGMNHAASAPSYFTVGGDCQLASGLFNVVALTGPASGALPINKGLLQWGQSPQGGAATLGQLAQGNAAAPVSMHIAPQAPGAGAATTANGTPGGLSVDLAAPVSTGTEAYFQVTRGATPLLAFQPINSGSSCFWMFPSGAAATPSTSNAIMQTTASVLYVAPPAAGAIAFRGGGIATAGKFAVTSTGAQIGGEAAAFAGGSGVCGFTNATVIPTSLIGGAAGLVLYANGGNLELDGGAYQFNALVQSPVVQQLACLTDVAPQMLTIKCQQPFASASTNKVPLGVLVDLGSEVGGGTPASALQVNADGAQLFAWGPDPLSAAVPMAWMGSAARTSGNWQFMYQSGILRFSGSTGCSFSAGATTYFYVSAGNASFFNGIGALSGGGTNVIGIGDRTVAPTTNPSGGGVLYSEAGALKWRGSSGTVTTIASP